MRNPLMIVTALLSVFTFSACKHTQKTTNSQAGNEGLTAVMSVPQSVKTGAPVTLKFTVSNNSAKDLKFCKWHTPFEGFLNSYFDIKDGSGTDARYKGVMAKRVMPPPAESYITVKAGKSISAEVDLLKAYDLSTPGTYKIIYQGGSMSGIEKVNEVSVTITK